MAAPTGPKKEYNDSGRRIAVLSPTGYHGDPNIMRLIDQLAANCVQFVETGTEAGSTIAYTARMYPHLDCISVEMDEGTHKAAAYHLQNHSNVTLVNGHSLEFLQDITVPEAPALFWLDAHSHGWGCVVGGEVGIVLDRWRSGYIILDDFEVPGDDAFGFDWYESYGKLNWTTVNGDLTEAQRARITGRYYPNYKSPYGTRGWILITFGDIPFGMPEFVRPA